MTEKQHRSQTENEIPYYLLPQAVAKKVREWGYAVLRISVKRMHWHHYNVTIRTKPVPRELKTRHAVTITEPERMTMKPAGARRRRCTA